MKRNYRIWKKEQNRQNQEKEDEKNTTASLSNNDEVLVLSNECLHVDEQGIEWTINTAASYHATPHLEFFSYYRVKDFGTVKMENSSHSKIVGIGDVCFETNMGCKLTLKNVRHVPDLRLNLMSSFFLDQQVIDLNSLLSKIPSLNYVATLVKKNKRTSHYDFYSSPDIVFKDWPMEVVKLGLKDCFLLNY